jgi:hypothetical protein
MSPLRTAPYQTVVSAPIKTSPMMVALGAMKVSSKIIGVRS